MMDALLTESLEVQRQINPGKYISGKYVADCEVERITIKCSVQPIKPGDAIVKELGGERTDGGFYIFTKTQLFTSNESALKKADVVSYNGRQYEIAKVERWAGLMPHFKCAALVILAGEAE